MRRVRPIYILRFLRLLLDPNSNKEEIKALTEENLQSNLTNIETN